MQIHIFRYSSEILAEIIGIQIVTTNLSAVISVYQECQRTFIYFYGTLVNLKYKNRRDDVGSIVYECLLDCEFDHQSEVYSIRSTSLDIIEALSSKESRDKFTDNQLHNSIKLLKRFIDFATYLEDDKSQADLDVIYLEHYGTSNLEWSARLKEDYIKKIKLTHYAKQLDGE